MIVTLSEILNHSVVSLLRFCNFCRCLYFLQVETAHGLFFLLIFVFLPLFFLHFLIVVVIVTEGMIFVVR